MGCFIVKRYFLSYTFHRTMLKNLAKICLTLVVIPGLIAGAVWYLNERHFFDLTELDFKTEFSRESPSGKPILENEINLLSKKLISF